MGQGRKPLPSHLKVVTGNAGKRKVNHDEPEAPKARPKAPSWLPARSKRFFNELCDFLDEMKILSCADKTLIEQCAFYYNEWRETADIIKKQGRTFITHTQAGDEMIRSHPAVAQRNESSKILQSRLSELGLSPTARTRLVSNVGNGSGGDDLLD